MGDADVDGRGETVAVEERLGGEGAGETARAREPDSSIRFGARQETIMEVDNLAAA